MGESGRKSGADDARLNRNLSAVSAGFRSAASADGNGTVPPETQNGVESAGKPGSVVDCHSSGRDVTVALEQPTREQRGPRHCSPIWPCSRWGLPCHDVLPRVRCALTAPFHPYLCRIAAAIGGLLSAALSVDSRRPGVTWHRALWSPDFPRRSLGTPRQSGQLRRRSIKKPQTVSRRA